MFKQATPPMPVIPQQPQPAPPLTPATQKPGVKSSQPTFLGALEPTQSQQTSSTKTLLGA